MEEREVRKVALLSMVLSCKMKLPVSSTKESEGWLTDCTNVTEQLAANIIWGVATKKGVYCYKNLLLLSLLFA